MKENDYLVRVHKDEYAEVLNLLDKMRTEKAKQRAIQEQEMQIEAAVEVAISVIGIEETERILRSATRIVRNLKKVNNDEPLV